MQISRAKEDAMTTLLRECWIFKKELLKTSRLHTAMYAFLLTIIGFKLADPASRIVAIKSAFVFFGITSSIMVFNDLKDRTSDALKGKDFVFHNYRLVLFYWAILSIGIVAAMGFLSLISPAVASFCMTIWLLGIAYSYLRKAYILQNAIVALCSASPVLCGAIHRNSTPADVVLVFLSLFLIIFSREILDDAKDKNSDIGNKTTIPIKTELDYPKKVSYLSLCFCSIFLPESIKKDIDLILNGKWLKTHMIISSLLSYASLLLFPVASWLAFMPFFLLVIASAYIFAFLMVDEKEMRICMSKASKLYNLSIGLILIILFLI